MRNKYFNPDGMGNLTRERHVSNPDQYRGTRRGDFFRVLAFRVNNHRISIQWTTLQGHSSNALLYTLSCLLSDGTE